MTSSTEPKLRGEFWQLTRSAAKRFGVAGSKRPCLIIQNNAFKPYGTRTVCTLTSAFKKECVGQAREAIGLKSPRDTQVIIVPSSLNGLTQLSFISCDQLYTLRNKDFKKRLGCIDDELMKEVDAALRLALNLSGAETP